MTFRFEISAVINEAGSFLFSIIVEAICRSLIGLQIVAQDRGVISDGAIIVVLERCDQKIVNGEEMYRTTMNIAMLRKNGYTAPMPVYFFKPDTGDRDPYFSFDLNGNSPVTPMEVYDMVMPPRT